MRLRFLDMTELREKEGLMGMQNGRDPPWPYAIDAESL